MEDKSLTQLLQIKYPIIQAPMAGGITTTELVTAVSESGGLGSVGAGYMSADGLRTKIKEIQANGIHSFGVNIFVPDHFSVEEHDVSLANERLQHFHNQLEI